MLKSFNSYILTPLRDFIYPPLCHLCDTKMSMDRGQVCSRCWTDLSQIKDDDPAFIEIKNRLISSGFVEQFVTIYLFEKKGRFQELIHLLKYKGIKSVGNKLGFEMGSKIKLNNEKFNFIVPLPLHKVKRRERGYNQSDYLAAGISRVLEVNIATDLLLRIKATKTQTDLNFQERKANVKDAFIVNQKYNISGSVILLVDDVVTTGATIEAAARKLVENGANKICVACAGVAKGEID